MRGALRLLATIVAIGVAAPAPVAAAAREPRLTVPASRLAAALTCFGDVAAGRPAPVLFVPGTGSDGSNVYVLGRGAFDAIGHPVCALSLPERATGDLQVSVQYVVHAIRELAGRAGGPIAVAGVSQGGLLARVAVTYWPSVRPLVADVVTAAAPHHGVRASADEAARCIAEGCPPALWQQAARSRFVRALEAAGDETPGRVAYTTIRSATDEVVRPQAGPRPTSALEGASNLLIQAVCPGRTTTHIGTVVDSVTIAALDDAVSHRGPARASRLPADVCAHPYGTGLDEQQTSAFLALAADLLRRGVATVPVVRREPPLRPWMLRPPG